MRNVFIVFRREMAGYFATPLAYVFIVIFLALAGAFTFFVGGFFERNQADLGAFFTLLPWLYLVLRSEEHTSELQSLMRISYAVFCLKKKKISLRNNQKHD